MEIIFEIIGELVLEIYTGISSWLAKNVLQDKTSSVIAKIVVVAILGFPLLGIFALFFVFARQCWLEGDKNGLIVLVVFGLLLIGAFISVILESKEDNSEDERYE